MKMVRGWDGWGRVSLDSTLMFSIAHCELWGAWKQAVELSLSSHQPSLPCLSQEWEHELELVVRHRFLMHSAVLGKVCSRSLQLVLVQSSHFNVILVAPVKTRLLSSCPRAAILRKHFRKTDFDTCSCRKRVVNMHVKLLLRMQASWSQCGQEWRRA